MSKLAVAFEMMDPLRDAVRSGLPAYGSCAGMILLADTVLDGRADQQGVGGIAMTVRRNAFGRQVDSFEQDLEFAGVGGGAVHAVFIRAPWVESMEPSVTVLATLPALPALPALPTVSAVSAAHAGPGLRGAEARIVAVRQGCLMATAFHPELTGDTRVHAYFVEIVTASTR